MSKWFGVIGFAETVETAPGVWEEQIILKPTCTERGVKILKCTCGEEKYEEILGAFPRGKKRNI